MSKYFTPEKADLMCFCSMRDGDVTTSAPFDIEQDVPQQTADGGWRWNVNVDPAHEAEFKKCHVSSLLAFDDVDVEGAQLSLSIHTDALSVSGADMERFAQFIDGLPSKRAAILDALTEFFEDEDSYEYFLDILSDENQPQGIRALFANGDPTARQLAEAMSPVGIDYGAAGEGDAPSYAYWVDYRFLAAPAADADLEGLSPMMYDGKLDVTDQVLAVRMDQHGAIVRIDHES
jgi:hypothetical protein